VIPSSPSLSADQGSFSTSAVTPLNNLVHWSVNKQTNVGTITLKAPQTYNALTVEMGLEFEQLCRIIIQKQLSFDSSESQDFDVNAIVITGAGKAFSAGGNLAWLHSLRHNTIQRNTDLMLAFYQSFLIVRQLPVPVVAALNGPAVGAGACLALACDLRVGVVGHQGILGFPFTSLGIHPGLGGTHLLSQCLGHRSGLVHEIMYLSKMLSSAEAAEYGLLNRVHDNASESALEMATDIALQHPLATRTMIQTLRSQQDAAGLGLSACLQREALAQAICYSRNDWGAGLKAVAAKQRAIFEPYSSP
jgi:enoyl-CoA hydratase/carnithine racemase